MKLTFESVIGQPPFHYRQSCLRGVLNEIPQKLTLNAPSIAVYDENVAGSMKNDGTKYVADTFVFTALIHP